MVHEVYPSGGRVRRRNRRKLVLTTTLAMLAISPLAFLRDRPAQDAVPPSRSLGATAPAQDATATASAGSYDRALVDPIPTLKPETLDFAHNAPLASTFRPPSPSREASVEPLAPAMSQDMASQEQALPLPPLPPLRMAQSDQPVPMPVPLPVPRPADLRASRPSETLRVASMPAPGPVKSAALPRATPQNAANSPSFIEKLFGIRPASPPASALGYAALENGTGSIAPSSRLDLGPNPAAGAGTAVYDISAQVVHMPNGEKLEAHSGLGDKLDDPRYVNVRMRGATPPGTYDLTERERLFHGVRALRLNPVGGNAAVYGRDGLLAHTYMLGPNGDSNGCVSFRNYDRFLQAYLRGEVKRLVVVAGRKQDLLPRIVNNRTGSSQRSAGDT
jgi:hypothetical protein